MAQAIRVFSPSSTNPNPTTRLGRRMVEVSIPDTNGPKAVTNLNLADIRKEQEAAMWAAHKGEIDLAAQALELARPAAEAVVTQRNRAQVAELTTAERAANVPVKCSFAGGCRSQMVSSRALWVGEKPFCHGCAPRAAVNWSVKLQRESENAQKWVNELLRR